MSLTGTFNLSCPCGSVRTSRRRPAPFSLRLSETERSRLAIEAAGAPLGAYIKAKVLGDTAPLRLRRSGLAVEDRQALGRALALLGRSRLASNVNQLAAAANSGSLLFTAATEALLMEALDDIRAIRRLLVTALGLKAETAP